jgi:hypothetical protein
MHTTWKFCMQVIWPEYIIHWEDCLQGGTEVGREDTETEGGSPFLYWTAFLSTCICLSWLLWPPCLFSLFLVSPSVFHHSLPFPGFASLFVVMRCRQAVPSGFTWWTKSRSWKLFPSSTRRRSQRSSVDYFGPRWSIFKISKPFSCTTGLSTCGLILAC